MKLDKEIVESIVKTNVTDNADVIKVLAALENAVKDAEAAKKANQVGKEKKKLMAVQLDDTDSVYILQAKDSFDEKTLIDIIRTKIPVDFNNSKAGIKNPVTKLSEAFEFVASKFWRDYDLCLKTKTPLDIIKSPNHKILTK